MLKRQRAIWLSAIAANFVLVGAVAKAEDDDEARLVAEAKALFRVVLTDERTPQKC